MFSPKRILIPVDFGASSRAALAQARALAVGRPEVRLRVLHVYEPPYYAPEALVSLPGQAPLPMIDYVRVQAQRQLDEELAGWAADPELAGRFDARLVSGLAFEELPQEAATWKADLIVMGTHGRRGFAHLLLGSVAERVVRQAPCPVMVVRATGTTVTPPTAFERVLVPIDFGPDSAAAARLGMALSKDGAGSVTLLHVVPTPAYAGEVLVPRAGGIRLGEFLHDEAQRRLEMFAQDVGHGGLDRCHFLVMQGSAAEQVVHLATEDNYGTIVMGTKGRHGLAHFFVGSVAERVLRHAVCPVVITRAVFGDAAQS